MWVDGGKTYQSQCRFLLPAQIICLLLHRNKLTLNTVDLEWLKVKATSHYGWANPRIWHLCRPSGLVKCVLGVHCHSHSASISSLKSETNHLARALTSSLTTLPPKPMKASAGGQASRSVAPSPIRTTVLYR